MVVPAMTPFVLEIESPSGRPEPENMIGFPSGSSTSIWNRTSSPTSLCLPLMGGPRGVPSLTIWTDFAIEGTSPSSAKSIQ